MKQCPTCREFYADKFGFCPVDGTQLAVEAAPAADEYTPPPFADEIETARGSRGTELTSAGQSVITVVQWVAASPTPIRP